MPQFGHRPGLGVLLVCSPGTSELSGIDAPQLGHFTSSLMERRVPAREEPQAFLAVGSGRRVRLWLTRRPAPAPARDPSVGCTPTLTSLEAAVRDRIADRKPVLVGLLQRLIGFDTASREPLVSGGEIPALQAFLAERLARHGAAVALTEPDAAMVAGHPYVPEGFAFAGRPQLVARFAGAGGGPSLLLNGHVDVVAPGPRADWRCDPFAGEVRDGLVHGRGACDMKGGIAAMVAAVEALRELGVQLAGDVIVNTVSEEGPRAPVGSSRHGHCAPTPRSCRNRRGWRWRGLSRLAAGGRDGRGTRRTRRDPTRPPREGGAVNAIDKARLVLDAIQRLNERWAATHRHPRLSPAHCVPTAIHGGEWIVSHPAACRIECHLEFLPEQADAGGWGAAARREFEAAIRRAAEQDEWLSRRPPRVEWLLGGVPSAEVAEDDPIVQTLLGVQRDLTSGSQVGGFDNWSDAATLIREAGIASVNYGPGDLRHAHTAREHVPVAELVACAQGIALTAMRFCGLAKLTPCRGSAARPAVVRSEPLLAPEVGVGVVVVVRDLVIARALVDRPGRGCAVEPHDPVTEVARGVLQRADERASEPAFPELRDDVHALELAGAVAERLDAPAAGRHAVEEADDEYPAGRREV